MPRRRARTSPARRAPAAAKGRARRGSGRRSRPTGSRRRCSRRRAPDVHPARRTRRVSASAAAGSGMSMKPNRQRTPSTESSSSGISSASITRCSTFARPSSAERRRATSTISDEKSLEIRRPCSPRIAAAAKPVPPGPAASSSTVSPGCGSSACTIHSLTGSVTLSISSRRRSQPAAIACQLSSAVRRYSSSSIGRLSRLRGPIAVGVRNELVRHHLEDLEADDLHACGRRELIAHRTSRCSRRAPRPRARSRA